MLDTDTKRRIDTARDLLVGKVPDPKSQVEQITIALIYKFMDDMDAEAEELGGKRKFFSGEYGIFGWAKLMQPGIGGHELLALYADGIAKMPENPGIPALFRDIFKNAYLPYRDPETLKSFLKVINDFTYDHSERLGDAFEYLLSVLGSQGDAGQFRTPRHIIDFIVEILAPRKEESLLDPACGTAGFLISAYKHILRTNTDARGNSTLTPDEKGRLAKKFNGYDISPDMVRLSLVNLYLHGFTDPHIFEYDTLTDAARWNEYADVILANPPFMSPKGGIRPHNRFSIQAKRSEVLFVDYIAEHLTPNGRAGIIVPEGIIFQSQNAYKDLRKMLVENSLVAVISLPAGCFNPYSGVKTSILLLDKSLARKSQTVAFFKVENDGYDLGAQRRPIQKNDLPNVQEELETYLTTLRERKDPSELSLTTALIVPKEKIAASGDYNLSGERYREGVVSNHSFPLVMIGDESIFRVESGGTPKSDVEVYWGGGIPWATLVDLPATDFISEITTTQRTISDKGLKESSAKMIPANSVIVSTRATIGRIAINRVPIATNQGFKNVIIEDPSKALTEYVALALTRLVPTMKAWATGGTFSEISKSKFCELEFPLPPLEIQKEIVAEIEGYQKVINGARAVLDNYRPHIPINPDWPMVELDSLCNIEHGYAFQGEFFIEEAREDLPILLTPGNFAQGGGLYFTPKNTKRFSGEVPDRFLLSKSDLVVVMTDLSPMMKILGMPAIIDADNYLHNQRIGKVVLKSDDVLKTYLRYAFLIDSVNGQIKREATGSTVRHTSPGRILAVKIPLPPLAEQQAIVAEIEAEQNLVNANRELITRFEAKIQTTLSRIWGET
jgi:type I restriction enzyme M protein